MAKTYTIKGFKSKYPFKQEPRSNKEIIYEGPPENFAWHNMSASECNGKLLRDDKFIMIYKTKEDAKQ